MSNTFDRRVYFSRPPHEQLGCHAPSEGEPLLVFARVSRLYISQGREQTSVSRGKSR